MFCSSCTRAIQTALSPYSSHVAIIVLFALLFPFLIFVFGDAGKPGTSTFALLCVYELSFVLFKVLEACKLPGLLGGLVAGFLLRNIPFIGEHVGAQVDPKISSILRSFALSMILCRAGLELDFEVLQRLCGAVARLAVLPCLFEVGAITLLSMWLFGFPVLWGALLGFVVAAVSPAVVVPSLLALQDQGYGKSTGIPTVVCAAAALDDVFSIGGFSIFLSLAFAYGNSAPAPAPAAAFGNSTRLLAAAPPTREAPPLWWQIVKIPLELVIGVVVGSFFAWILVVLFPSKVQHSEAFAEIEETAVEAKPPEVEADTFSLAGFTEIAWRVLMLIILAACILFGLKKADMQGAAALAALIVAGGASLGWGLHAKEPVASCIGVIWDNLAAPMLFGLVGAGVSFDELDPKDVGLGLALLAIAVPVRCLATAFFAASCLGLTWKARLFMALAWMPKATVQAAVGPIALQQANLIGTDQEKAWGRTILTVAILAILVTAPFGAILIKITGPLLLVREEEAADVPESSPLSAEDDDEEDVADDSEDDDLGEDHPFMVSFLT
jgi:NhaP-type Na+/H+ or K+/H+ antiporter